jgi:adenosine deaminase
VCGAHRIGHGVRLREDGDLLHYVIDHRLPLECCPSSNVQTGAVRQLEAHPLKLYFDLGVRVTVNTDNRLITDTTVSKELWLAHTKMGIPFGDIKKIILAGFKSSFRPFHERQSTIRKIVADLERYDDEGRLRSAATPSEAPNRRAATSSDRTTA